MTPCTCDKTDRHDITEILLKVALNTITLIQKYCNWNGWKQYYLYIFLGKYVVVWVENNLCSFFIVCLYLRGCLRSRYQVEDSDLIYMFNTAANFVFSEQHLSFVARALVRVTVVGYNVFHFSLILYL